MKPYLVAVALLVAIGCSPVKRVTMEPLVVRPGDYKPLVEHPAYPSLTDLLHTRLELSFNWDSSFVIGKAYLDARPYFYASDQLMLDANGFEIKRVALVTGGRNTPSFRPLNYEYNGKKLLVQLDKMYTRDQTYTVLVEYVAKPDRLVPGKDIADGKSRGLYFVKSVAGDGRDSRQLWSQGEPESNSSWFPTINDPKEKMTQDVSLTVPASMVTLSNGELDFSTDNRDGSRTDTWRMEQPHSTYLTMIAAGTFTITKDKWRDTPLSYYLEPPFAKNARLIFGRTPEMLEFFSTKIGIDFPWPRYAQMVVRDFVTGAMENTTATVFYDKMNMDEGQWLDDNQEDVIAHELFHHWFGDLVTCKSWSNLALNESFATYGEYLWDEYKYGRDAADYRGMKDLQRYLGDPFNKDDALVRFRYTDKESLFDNVTYEKGGRILHLLRHTVGDEAFFRALRLYLEKFAYQSAEVHDLRRVFEQVTGQDLNWFFNQWFFQPGNPKLTVESRYDGASRQVIVNIAQTQDLAAMPLYRLPLAVDIYRNGKAERHQIVVEAQSQEFSFPAETVPDLVNVDADRVLVGEKVERKPLQQYLYQYDHAPLFMDRFEAISMLITYKKEKLARQKLIAALGDRNWYLRKLAVDFVPELDGQEREAVFPIISKMAVDDPRSYVRAAAVTILQQVFASKDLQEMLRKASADKAPSVIKAVGKW